MIARHGKISQEELSLQPSRLEPELQGTRCETYRCQLQFPRSDSQNESIYIPAMNVFPLSYGFHRIYSMYDYMQSASALTFLRINVMNLAIYFKHWRLTPK
jgi:hypothetical protein